MSNDTKTFIWAHDVHANVKEPIQALREHGWRYGDVPAASNFNWIFKTMTEEIALLKEELRAHKEHVGRAFAQHQAINEKVSIKIKKLCDEISHIDETRRNDALHLARSLEATWELLRGFNAILCQKDGNFPIVPWPSKVFPD